jgi:hypothetical protein
MEPLMMPFGPKLNMNLNFQQVGSIEEELTGISSFVEDFEFEFDNFNSMVLK